MSHEEQIKALRRYCVSREDQAAPPKRCSPEQAERMALLKERLQAKIALKDAERGRPLTASEKLENLRRAIFEEGER